MPTYVFRCESCGKIKAVKMKMSEFKDYNPGHCEECEGFYFQIYYDPNILYKDKRGDLTNKPWSKQDAEH